MISPLASLSPVGDGIALSWTYWKTQSKVVFIASDSTNILNKVVDGKLYNEKPGSSDYITVTGSGLDAVYQVPNTATYIDADTDYAHFKTNEARSTCDGNRLIGYDLQRTIVDYSNESPYVVKKIMIVSENLTAAEINRASKDFHLSVYWSGTWNDNGYLKENRTGQQLWTAEAVWQAETTTLTARFSTPATDERKTLIDNFFISEKANGSPYAKLDCLCLIGADSQASCQNWISNAINATLQNTPGFSADRFFSGDAISQYIDTMFDPSSGALKYQRNSATIFIIYHTNRSAGLYDGAGTERLVRSFDGLVMVNNTPGQGYVTCGAGPGLIGGVRESATVLKGYKNKALIDTQTVNSSAMASITFKLFQYDGTYNNNKIAGWGFGQALSAIELGQIYDDAKTYLDAIGNTILP